MSTKNKTTSKTKAQLQAKIEELELQLKQQKDELEQLLKVVQVVSDLDLDKVLKEIVKIAIRISRADSCFVYVLNRNRQDLVLRASKNPHPRKLKHIRMKVGVGITGWVARHKETVVIGEKAFNDSRFHLFKNLPEDKYHAFLSIPIMHKRKVVGVLNLQNKSKHEFPPERVETLETIGKLVGGAVENARLIEESIDLKLALDTRKALEKAKGLLMKRLDLTEEEAFQRIRKKSMNLGKSIKDICEAIILSDKVG